MSSSNDACSITDYTLAQPGGECHVNAVSQPATGNDRHPFPTREYNAWTSFACFQYITDHLMSHEQFGPLITNQAKNFTPSSSDVAPLKITARP